MSPGPLALTDDAFFADPLPAVTAQLPTLADAGLRGLLLDGPAAVNVDAHHTLPLAGVYALTTAQLELGSPRRRALLVASGVEQGDVRVGLALHPGKEPARRKPTAGRAPKGLPEAPADKSVSFVPFAVDARAQLAGLPWAPATWTFWLLLRDAVSAPVRVRLERRDTAAPPPPPGPWPAPVWPPASDHARYDDVDDAPPPPAAVGVTLDAERALVPTEPGARWLLRAGWRLPVRPQDRVPEPREGQPPPPFAPEVKAVVPLTLVITAAGAAGPWRLPLRVPCAELSGDAGQGRLELDLLRVPGAPRAPGETYFIYAVAGDVLAGPAVTALVSEDALPKGVA